MFKKRLSIVLKKQVDDIMKLCRSIDLDVGNQQIQYYSEAQIFANLCKKLLIPLFGSVEYSGNIDLRNVPGARKEPLGLGTLHTWHGVPDLRINGCYYVLSMDVDEGSDIDNKFEVGDVNVDHRLNDDSNIMNQLVSTAVVSCFTDRNQLSTMSHPCVPVPTILINPDSFIVCCYDSDSDVLLLSDQVQLINPLGGISRTAVLILWTVTNYR